MLVGAAVPASGMGARPVQPRDVDGVPYLRIDRVAKAADWHFDRGRLVLRAGGHTVRMAGDRRQIRFDEQVLWLHEPVRKVGRHWRMAEADLRAVINPLLNPSAFLGRDPVALVVLDAGHGGDDSGATGAGETVEKELTLDLCNRIRRSLLSQGIRVELTRTSDRFIPLEERPRLAAAREAGLFVSIHFNSAVNPDATGVETYALTVPGLSSTADFSSGARDDRAYPGNRHDETNTVLASRVHAQLLRACRSEDRGIRRARFAVLRDAPCPAVLVECGFLSNLEEETRILSPRYRQDLAEGIATGIRDYVRQVQLARVAVE